MLKKIFVFLIIAFLALVTFNAPTARAATLYVGSAAACGVASPYPDVSSALAAAANGDVIVLCEDITENVANVNINVNVKITGYFNGLTHEWKVIDTDATNPTISISSQVFFDRLSINVSSSAASDPTSFISVSNTFVTFNDTFVVGLVKNVAPAVTSVVTATSSQILFNLSVMNVKNTTADTLTRGFNLDNSNLTVIDSDIIQMQKGYAIYGYFDSASINYFNVTLVNSDVFSRSMYVAYTGGDALALWGNNNVDGEVNIRDSYFEGYDRAVYILATLASSFDVNVMNSEFRATTSAAFRADAQTNSYMNIYMNPSTGRANDPADPLVNILEFRVSQSQADIVIMGSTFIHGGNGINFTVADSQVNFMSTGIFTNSTRGIYLETTGSSSLVYIKSINSEFNNVNTNFDVVLSSGRVNSTFSNSKLTAGSNVVRASVSSNGQFNVSMDGTTANATVGDGFDLNLRSSSRTYIELKDSTLKADSNAFRVDSLNSELEIFIDPSKVISEGNGLDLRDFDNSELLFTLIDSEFTSRWETFDEVSDIDFSDLTFDIQNSVVNSTSDILFDWWIYDSNAWISFTNSEVYADDDVFEFDAFRTTISIDFEDSSITSEDYNIMDGDLEDTDLTVNIFNSDVSSEDEIFEISGDRTSARFMFEDSSFASEDWEAIDASMDINSYIGVRAVNSQFDTEDEVFDIYLDDDTRGYFNITRSHLDSEDDDAIDIHADSDSYAYVNITRSVLHPDTGAWSYGLDIASHSWSSADVWVYYTFLESFDFSGDDIDAEIVESVYDELESHDHGNNVVSTWTIMLNVLASQSLQPLVGAVVNYYFGTTFLGSSVTGGGGLTTFTFTYNFDSDNPFIEDLKLTAVYRRSINSTLYTTLEPRYTIPYWYGNFTILMNLFVLKANLAGHIGFGFLDIQGLEGTLRIGSNIQGGWVNTYTVVVNNVQQAGHLMVVNVMVFFDGNWVDGVIMVNYKSGVVYMRFGGIELYGSTA